ncbi:TIGR00730 family Rossman fold protein [Marinilabilia sp.]|uniref:LOG family protein n=1 Tax=Marinilabilia sp. TaxID=2021252 RepID=UPI0025B9ABD8|nr:TIGR00730 family Rossman fold protein [Marinilabilia sp.]
MKKIAVFCASSPKVPEVYFDAAREVSAALVKAGYGIIYGGGAIGLMGAVADEALKNNGVITGIIPRFMVDVEWEHKDVEDMIHVETMHKRKELMVQGSAGILALPGGTGTLEELFEVMSLKKLGQYRHPIVVLNTNGYYDGLLQQTHKMVEEKFMRPIHNEMWSIVEHPCEVVSAFENTKPWGEDAIKFAGV